MFTSSIIRVTFLYVRKNVTSSFLDNNAKDSFNMTTNTVFHHCQFNALQQSLCGRFLISVIEGVSNGGSLTFLLPTDRRTNFYSHAYHGSTPWKYKSYLLPVRESRLPPPSSFPHPISRFSTFPSSSLSTLTGKSSRACYNNVTQLLALVPSRGNCARFLRDIVPLAQKKSVLANVPMDRNDTRREGN